MLISLSEIMSVPDKTLRMEVPIRLEYFELKGIQYEFAYKDPVKISITNLGERRVSIEASTKLALNIPCSRCLENVVTDFDIHISKEVDFRETEEERAKELDELNYISGYNLDVDVLVYDEILIDFPMKVLCDENCKGICNVCGLNLNNGTCDCESTGADPRMSVIRDIFKNFKEV